MSIYLVYVGSPSDPNAAGEVRIAYEVRRGDAATYDVLERDETVVTLPAAKAGAKRRDIATTFDAHAGELVAAVQARLDDYQDALAHVLKRERRWPLEAADAALLTEADPVAPKLAGGGLVVTVESLAQAAP